MKNGVKYIYVRDCHGNPMMPCSPCKCRKLIKSGKCKVVDFEPFTIQFIGGSSGYKQEVVLGVDTGSVHIGLCASTKSNVLMFMEVEMRKDIVDNLSTKRMMRRTRRSRKLRYRQPRFNNRVSSKKQGWLVPSIKYKKDKHLKTIDWICSILPISTINVEICNFDIQKIKNPEVQGVDYQQGEQLNFYNVREYVLSRDNHTCQHCHGKSGDKVLEVHHLESRKTGGNAPNNLITLCSTCHHNYHQGKIELNIKRGKSFKDSSVVNSFKYQLIDELKLSYPDKQVNVTFGYITKSKRINHNIPKSHYFDTLCITNNLDSEPLDYIFKCHCFGRHNRSLHVMNFKKGHKRRSAIADYWLGKDKNFTRYDKVWCNGEKCFITGSSNGYPYIKDIDGNKTAGVKTVTTTNKLKRIYHAKHGCMVDKLMIKEDK